MKNTFSQQVSSCWGWNSRWCRCMTFTLEATRYCTSEIKRASAFGVISKEQKWSRDKNRWSIYCGTFRYLSLAALFDSYQDVTKTEPGGQERSTEPDDADSAEQSCKRTCNSNWRCLTCSFCKVLFQFLRSPRLVGQDLGTGFASQSSVNSCFPTTPTWQ